MRQIEGEGAALSRRALQLDFAAEQVCELAADGEAKSRASVFAAGTGVGLLEGLEDDLLLLLRNANAGVRNFKGDDGCSLAEDRVVPAPSGVGVVDGQPHTALLGEFEGV